MFLAWKFFQQRLTNGVKGRGKQFSECIFFFGLKGFTCVLYVYLMGIGNSACFIEIESLHGGELIEYETVLEQQFPLRQKSQCCSCGERMREQQRARTCHNERGG